MFTFHKFPWFQAVLMENGELKVPNDPTKLIVSSAIGDKTKKQKQKGSETINAINNQQLNQRKPANQNSNGAYMQNFVMPNGIQQQAVVSKDGGPIVPAVIPLEYKDALYWAAIPNETGKILVVLGSTEKVPKNAKSVIVLPPPEQQTINGYGPAINAMQNEIQLPTFPGNNGVGAELSHHYI